MTPLLSTAGLIFVAEMADKTQLLALAFAARHKASQVAAGVALATAFLGMVAVGFGEALIRLVPVPTLKVVAGSAFLAVAAWTLLASGRDSEAVDAHTGRWPVFAVVAAAFFLAEIGDKTQLAAVALAARFSSPIMVWVGFMVGMLAADMLGLAVGRALGPRLPRRLLAVGSALLFALFGALTLVEAWLRP